MGIGKVNDFNSKAVDYSTPLSLFKPLAEEFDLKIDIILRMIYIFKEKKIKLIKL